MRGGFKLSYSKIVKLACFQATWAAFTSPIPRMAVAGLGGGVDVDFRSPAGTAPDSQTGVGERRDGDAPGGRSRVMCHGEQLSSPWMYDRVLPLGTTLGAVAGCGTCELN